MAPPARSCALAAARVLTPDGLVGPAEVIVGGGIVREVRSVAAGTRVPDRIIAPGFVDLQVNGIDDVDVATADGADWERLDQRLLAQGVTTWCPTLITAPLASYPAALARIAVASERPAPGRPAIAGAHLEGPFLGGAPGIHSVAHLAALDLRWLAILPPVVVLVTLAPELAGAPEAIAALRARAVTVALGHSTATFEQAGAAVDAGASLATHLFNGMGALHHREPGLVGAALADDRLAVSLIADLVHVHPALLRTVFRAKGAGRVVLVTDAVAWRTPAAAGAGISLRDGAPRSPAGPLAGSVLTMNRAVSNVVAAGVPLVDALEAASSTPAAVLGLSDRGRLAPGLRADLVVLSPALAVEEVWIAGEPVSGDTSSTRTAGVAQRRV